MPKAWRTREGVHILLSARICTESSKLAFEMIWLISLGDSLLTTSPQLVFVRFYHYFLRHSSCSLGMSASMPMIRNLLALIITKKLVAWRPKGKGSHVPWKCRKVVSSMPKCDKYSPLSCFLHSVFGPYADVKLSRSCFKNNVPSMLIWIYLAISTVFGLFLAMYMPKCEPTNYSTFLWLSSKGWMETLPLDEQQHALMLLASRQNWDHHHHHHHHHLLPLRYHFPSWSSFSHPKPILKSPRPFTPLGHRTLMRLCAQMLV